VECESKKQEIICFSVSFYIFRASPVSFVLR